MNGLGRVRAGRQNLSNMSQMPSTKRQPTERGFTLVEIMIAVAIVAILAAVALPSFMDSVRKSRRTDAFNAIAAVQQAQERWRSNRASYATNAQMTLSPAANPPGLGVPAVTTKGYYDLALSDVAASGYTATATAKAGTSQASDDNCKALAARVTGGNLEFGAGASADAINWSDPNRCWAR